jgi:hypothetical protein
MLLLIAQHGGSSLNQRMTPATNALDEHRKPENMQQNSYSAALDPANNQALIKEVITVYSLCVCVCVCFLSICSLSVRKHLTVGLPQLA